MMDETIRRIRKEKGLSQEEMAVRLHVVRQTVSKWETGRSVPDAEVLVRMAELLEVPVSRLLGADTEDGVPVELSEELARVNAQLAAHKQQVQLLHRAGEKRGLVLFFAAAAMMAALLVKNELAALLLVGVCTGAAVVVFFRNIALLTRITTATLKTDVLRVTTIFDSVVLAVGILCGVLTALDVVAFSENGEKMAAMLLVSCVLVFAGIMAPRWPYSRHTGLRLPWTLQDEDTWNLAHRIIGWISLPTALLYMALAMTIPEFEIVTLGTIVIWIGIPGLLSYRFFRRKMLGR